MPEAARQPWHDFRTDSSGIVVYSNRMHITSNRSWFHAHELEAKQLPWHDVPNRFARDDYLYKCDAQLFRTMVDFTAVVRVQEASKVKVLSGFLRNLHWKMRTLTLCQMVPRWMQASLAFDWPHSLAFRQLHVLRPKVRKVTTVTRNHSVQKKNFFSLTRSKHLTFGSWNHKSDDSSTLLHHPIPPEP